MIKEKDLQSQELEQVNGGLKNSNGGSKKAFIEEADRPVRQTHGMSSQDERDLRLRIRILASDLKG